MSADLYHAKPHAPRHFAPRVWSFFPRATLGGRLADHDTLKIRSWLELQKLSFGITLRSWHKPSQTKGTKMSKAKAPKAKVNTTIPAVNTAWRTFCKATTSNETANRKAVLSLADIIESQTASINSIKKSVDDTATISPLITSSQIRTLPTFKALEKKHAEFRALPLKKALTFAAKAYDLLGKGEAEKHSYGDAVKLVDDAQAEKTRKEKARKAEKAGKTPKEKKSASLMESLQAVYALVDAIDPAQIGDKEIDLLNEILGTIEIKMREDAEI